MGAAKATLPFGDNSLVGSVVATLRPVFREVLVVTRDKHSLVGLEAHVLIGHGLRVFEEQVRVLPALALPFRFQHGDGAG